MEMVLALLAVLASWPAAADQPLRVVTENAEYCHLLASRVASQPGSDEAQARALAEQGMRLCEAGQVRTGIAKLRRALRANLSN